MEVLNAWLHGCLYLAAFFATAFPAVWAWSRWWSTLIGKLLMLQAVAFALALDMTALFQVWHPPEDHVLTLFWVQTIVFTLIAISTCLLTVTMVRMNYIRRENRDKR